MGRMVDVDDLLTSGEIAQLVGVVPSAVANWCKRYGDFPEPVRIFGKNTRVWLRSDFLDWFRGRYSDLQVEAEKAAARAKLLLEELGRDAG